MVNGDTKWDYWYGHRYLCIKTTVSHSVATMPPGYLDFLEILCHSYKSKTELAL